MAFIIRISLAAEGGATQEWFEGGRALVEDREKARVFAQERAARTFMRRAKYGGKAEVIPADPPALSFEETWKSTGAAWRGER